MEYSIVLHPLSEVELWEAVDWYDAQKDALGKAFAKQIQHTVQKIGQNPGQFPCVLGQKRQAMVPNFPYVIIYEVSGDTIYILAIFHTKRDPDTWAIR
jgi:plasmid stabilization system protein ParE